MQVVAEALPVQLWVKDVEADAGKVAMPRKPTPCPLSSPHRTRPGKLLSAGISLCKLR